MTRDEELVAGLAEEYSSAKGVRPHLDLSAVDRAMLDYAAKLTRAPWSMERADVEALRAVGFPDAAILDINQVTGYFAFVNRLADGLGVELEPGRADG